MQWTAATIPIVLVLAACAGPSGGASPSSSGAVSGPVSAPAASAAPASAGTESSPSMEASSSASARALPVDTLARTTVEGLAVRAEPTTAAERLAVLEAGERVYLVRGPVGADGHPWFLVAPAEDRISTDCSDETSTALVCATEIGWVAAASADGDAWLETVDPGCPAQRDAEAFLGLEPAERLACAGDGEWRLVAYLAPSTEGRGCFPVWLVDPGWLDGACNFLYPQPVERAFDTDTSLQVFVPPELGSCGPEGCPFDSLKGSWVEIVGQLDHPAAQECTMVLNSSIDGEPPYPPIGPELTVFNCRLNFVVNDLQPTDPPANG